MLRVLDVGNLRFGGTSYLRSDKIRARISTRLFCHRTAGSPVADRRNAPMHCTRKYARVERVDDESTPKRRFITKSPKAKIVQPTYYYKIKSSRTHPSRDP